MAKTIDLDYFEREIDKQDEPRIFPSVPMVPMSQSETKTMLTLGRSRFAVYEPQINDLLDQSNSIVVRDPESEKRCGEIGLRAKRFAKEIETREKALVKPAADFVKAIRSFVKTYTDRCDVIEATTKKKGKDYVVWRELERRKAEKIMQEARDRVQKEVNEDAKKAGVVAPQLPSAVVAQETKPITRTEEGSVSYATKKKGRVVNPELLPEKYWIRTINERMIQQDVDHGIEEIPGVELWDDVDVRYRT